MGTNELSPGSFKMNSSRFVQYPVYKEIIKVFNREYHRVKMQKKTSQGSDGIKEK